MSRRFITALSAAAMLFASSGAAFAQSQPLPLPSVAPAQPSARSVELAHRYVLAIHMDRTFAQVMGPMSKMMLEQFSADSDKLPPEFKRALEETMIESSQTLMQEMMKRLEPEIARIFSEDELQALVTLYESPTGQSILSKTPQMTEATVKMMPDIIPLYTQDFEKRLCTKIDCSKPMYKKYKQPTSA